MGNETNNPEGNYDLIPEEFKVKRQWMLFDTSAETDRRPFGWDDVTQTLDFSGSWQDPTDWLTFEEAREAASTKASYGIGFVFRTDGDYIPIDLDGCLDIGCLDMDGEFKDWVPSLDSFTGETYIEYSPSGTGLHLYVKHHEQLPPWWQNQHFSDKEHEGIEAYDNKFFSFTGNRHVDSAGTVGTINPDGFLWNCYESVAGETPDLNLGNDGSGGTDGPGTDSDIDVSVYDVISRNSYPTGERCAHPCHGSGTGTNFHVDDGGDSWRCWRHSITGGALHIVGMEENIISCGDWKENGLDSDTWSDIFDAARDRGLDVPEQKGENTRALESLESDENEGGGSGSSGSNPQGERSEDGAPEGSNETESDGGDSGGDEPSDDEPSWAEKVAPVARAVVNPERPETLKYARNEASTAVMDDYDFISPILEGDDPSKRPLWIYHPGDGAYERRGESIISEDASGVIKYFSTGDQDEVADITKRRNGVELDQLDAEGFDRTLVNVENGVFDYDNDEVLDNDPKYNFRHVHPFEVHPDADGERFMEFLENIIPNEDERRTILEYIGYIFHDGYPDPHFLMCYGTGGNGKGVLFDVIRELVGSLNSTSVGLEHLTNETDYNLAELDGSMVNIDGDIPGSHIDTSQMNAIKKLTGRDPMTVQRKFEHPFELENRSKLIFAANKPPRFNDSTNSVARRLLAIEFPFEFVENPGPGQKQKMDHEKLMDELTSDEALSGLFNLAMDAYREKVDRGHFAIEEGSSNMERFMDYQKTADPITDFADTCLTNEEGLCLPKDAVYSAYNTFSQQRDRYPVDKRVFFKKIRQNSTVDIHDKQVTVKKENGRERPRVCDHLWLSPTGVEYISEAVKKDIMGIITCVHPTNTYHAEYDLGLDDGGDDGDDSDGDSVGGSGSGGSDTGGGSGGSDTEEDRGDRSTESNPQGEQSADGDPEGSGSDGSTTQDDNSSTPVTETGGDIPPDAEGTLADIARMREILTQYGALSTSALKGKAMANYKMSPSQAADAIESGLVRYGELYQTKDGKIDVS